MRASFRKSDIERAVSAVKAAGCEVISVEVTRDGTVRIVTSGGLGLTTKAQQEWNGNPWDHS